MQIFQISDHSINKIIAFVICPSSVGFVYRTVMDRYYNFLIGCLMTVFHFSGATFLASDIYISWCNRLSVISFTYPLAFPVRTGLFSDNTKGSWEMIILASVI